MDLENTEKIIELAKETKTAVRKTKTDVDLLTSYAKALKVEIHESGEMKFTRTSVSYEYFDELTNIFAMIGFKIYPKEFTGSINRNGKGELKISKKGYSLFGSKIPIKFECKIDQNLNINGSRIFSGD